MNFFCSLSGLILNRSKSVGITLGKVNKINDNFEQILWNPDKIKVLGVYFSKQNKDIINFNWKLKLDKIDMIIKSWKLRKLTLMGKIQVVNSLLIPNVTYLATALPITDKI